jgi:acetyltransferase-like isoleucine patch superfamily enzyme
MLLLKIISLLLPWKLRRYFLIKVFGYEINATARIKLAWVFPKKLVMKSKTRIDHFTIAIHLDSLVLEDNATIGRSNWITGFPTGTNSRHFQHQEDRKSELLLGESSAITKQHHIDCTNSIKIGKFVTIAGYQSQLLTHSIDVYKNRQDSKPIVIGNYAFVGTNVVLLGGAVLPAYSVLGAKSLLNKPFEEQWKLYAGVPAKAISDISRNAQYFSRVDGFVY